jgi:hypothetical protein
MEPIDFQSRLSAKLADDAAYAERMGRIGKMQIILSQAFRKMREIGASDADIVGVLRHAIDVLEGRD